MFIKSLRLLVFEKRNRGQRKDQQDVGMGINTLWSIKLNLKGMKIKCTGAKIKKCETFLIPSYLLARSRQENTYSI